MEWGTSHSLHLHNQSKTDFAIEVHKTKMQKYKCTVFHAQISDAHTMIS
jgi:hypothetical protein